MPRGVRVLLAMIVVLSTGALALAADDLDALVAQLDGPETDKRYPAYTALQAKKDPAAIPLLVKALPAMGLTAQNYGISILQSYPLDLQHPALRKLFGADSAYLKGAAAAVLARSGDAKAMAVVVDAVSQKGVEPTAMSMLLGQIYGLKDGKLQSAERGLLTVDGELQVVSAALYTLYSVQDVVTRADAVKLMSSSSGAVRGIAAAYLYRFGDDDRAEDLAKSIESGEVPHSEFIKIRTFLTSSPRVAERILDAVTSRLESEPGGYYVAAMIDFLSDHRHAKAWPIVRKLLDSADATIAKAAFDALAKVPGSFSADDLRGMLASPEETKRLSAAISLRRIDDLSGLSVVIEIAKKGGTSTKYLAAEALGGFRVPGAIEPLLDLLMDEASNVRSYAYSSLMAVLQTLFPYRRLNFNKTGYSATAAADVRAAAAKQFREWWAANKNKEW